jgi:hypothetical protein
MPAYSVKFDSSVNVGSRNGVKGALVFAATSADALALLQAEYGDDMDSGWANATVTQIAAGADLAGWSLRVQVLNSTGSVVSADCTVVGAAAATIDTIAALMVTALNATAPIAGAAYNAGTQVLKVAETTDNLGDHRVVVEFWPPVGTLGQKSNVAGFVASKVDVGLANAALSVTFVADAYTVPAVTDMFKAAQ